MKKLVALAIFGLAMTGCSKVEPGYVGIKVNEYGSQKGVEDFPLQTGRVWYNPFTETIYKFPTFVQTATWTKDNHEESPNDDSITFNSVEGAIINADIALEYKFESSKVPNIFVEFRRDADEITWQFMRKRVRDNMNQIASTMKVVDIFGAKKRQFLEEVETALRDELEPKGLVVRNVAFVGALRVDPKVEASINAVIEATQKAIEAENKVRQAEAEALQAIAKADGQAKSALKIATARAEANKKINATLTPELIQWQMLQKWNGTPPMFIGSGTHPTPLIPLPLPKKGN